MSCLIKLFTTQVISLNFKFYFQFIITDWTRLFKFSYKILDFATVGDSFAELRSHKN